MQHGSSYDCKCVGTRNDGDNDDDYDDVILVLMLTVITSARWLPESIESWVGGLDVWL